MSIPPAFMPGAAPGGGPAGSPSPGGVENAEQMLRVLASLQQAPPPSGDDQMLNEASQKFHEASVMLNAAYARVVQRSARASKELAQASKCAADGVTKISAAREALQDEGTRPLAPPPDFGMPAPTGAPGPAGF